MAPALATILHGSAGLLIKNAERIEEYSLGVVWKAPRQAISESDSTQGRISRLIYQYNGARLVHAYLGNLFSFLRLCSCGRSDEIQMGRWAGEPPPLDVLVLGGFVLCVPALAVLAVVGRRPALFRFVAVHLEYDPFLVHSLVAHGNLGHGRSDHDDNHCFDRSKVRDIRHSCWDKNCLNLRSR